MGDGHLLAHNQGRVHALGVGRVPSMPEDHLLNASVLGLMAHERLMGLIGFSGFTEGLDLIKAQGSGIVGFRA